MYDPHEWPRSDGFTVPKISRELYFDKTANSTGTLISLILYGIVIVLFFQCMAALIKPVHHGRERVKWRLVSYTVIMFSFVTVFTLLGAFGNYQSFGYPGAGNTTPNVMFLLNYWLADGLLLYRCYVIYSMNPRAVAIPCLMYLSSVAMGVMMLLYRWNGFWVSVAFRFGIVYLTISVLLNVLLTLMIVIRLVLHNKNIRAAMAAPGGISGLYKTTITMLIESSVLYAVSSLLVIGSLVAKSNVVDVFLPILAETQVIAPLLIIQRIANQSALTSGTIPTDQTASFNFRNGRRQVHDSGPPPGGYPMSQADKRGKKPLLGTTIQFPSKCR